jgi:hypothetical protein
LPYVNALEIESYVQNSILIALQCSFDELGYRKESIHFLKRESLKKELARLMKLWTARETRELEGLKLGVRKRKATYKEKLESSRKRRLLLNKMEIIQEELNEFEKYERALGGHTQAEKGLRAVWPDIEKVFRRMTDQQKRNVILEALDGNFLHIRVLRKIDLAQKEATSVSKEHLRVPVYKIFRGHKIMTWTVEGKWKIELNAILKQVFPAREIHFLISNYGPPFLHRRALDLGV